VSGRVSEEDLRKEDRYARAEVRLRILQSLQHLLPRQPALPPGLPIPRRPRYRNALLPLSQEPSLGRSIGEEEVGDGGEDDSWCGFDEEKEFPVGDGGVGLGDSVGHGTAEACSEGCCTGVKSVREHGRRRGRREVKRERRKKGVASSVVR
jgi:hypothetical protein